MNANIRLHRPSDVEMNNIVTEWWKTLDAVNGEVPKVGIPSGDDYVFLYGSYEGNGVNPAVAHEGTLSEEFVDRIVVAPLVNGRYGTGGDYSGELGDVDTGVLLSQYTD